MTNPITEARHDLDRAWRMYHSTMPFQDWCTVVRPEIAAIAVKRYGSLFGMFNDARIWICKLLLMAIRQVDELQDATQQLNGKQQ
jgi:hypothetical protein